MGRKVSGSGSDEITITLENELIDGNSYYVHIADGSFRDLSGNDIAEISNSSTSQNIFNQNLKKYMLDKGQFNIGENEISCPPSENLIELFLMINL